MSWRNGGACGARDSRAIRGANECLRWRVCFPVLSFLCFWEEGAVVEVGDVTYMSVRVGALGDNVRWVGSDGTMWSDDGLTEYVFASGERVSVLKDL